MIEEEIIGGKRKINLSKEYFTLPTEIANVQGRLSTVMSKKHRGLIWAIVSCKQCSRHSRQKRKARHPVAPPPRLFCFGHRSRSLSLSMASVGKCRVCGKTVYQLEAVTAVNSVYHKGCFKCMFFCIRMNNYSSIMAIACWVSLRSFPCEIFLCLHFQRTFSLIPFLLFFFLFSRTEWLSMITV